MCKFRLKEILADTIWLRLVIIGLFLCLSPASADAVTATVAHNVFFEPGYDGGTPQTGIVQTYWQVQPGTLHYQRDSSTGLISAVLTTSITISAAGKVYAQDKYNLKTTPVAPDDALSQKIFDIKKVLLPKGQKYVLTLRLSENGFPAADYVYTDTVDLETPVAPRPFYSGIQQIDTAVKSSSATTKNMMYKDSTMLLPYTINFIDENTKHIRVYYELYDLRSLDTSVYPLRQQTYISRDAGGLPTANTLVEDTITQPGNFSRYKEFDLSPCRSGNYYVVTKLINRLGRQETVNNYFFQLVNKNPVAIKHEKTSQQATNKAPEEKIDYVNLQSTFVAQYQFKEVKAILEMIRPVADAVELNAINSLMENPDDKYMRYFVYNHFDKVNPRDPEKAWKEFAEKIKEINRLFGKGTTPGYETDRGKMYIKYGKPDERIVVNNEQGVYPYEIWQYFAIGETGRDAVFLFYLPGATIEPKLLHSTAIGEVYNNQWRSMLYFGANPNSRAEQYLGNK